MLKELINLANHLDKRGFRKEADYLDAIITSGLSKVSSLDLGLKSMDSNSEADPSSLSELKRRVKSLHDMVDEWEMNGERNSEMIEGMVLIETMIEEMENKINLQESVQQEIAMETGRAHGIRGYNEAMGQEIQDPDEFTDEDWDKIHRHSDGP